MIHNLCMLYKTKLIKKKHVIVYFLDNIPSMFRGFWTLDKPL